MKRLALITMVTLLMMVVCIPAFAADEIETNKLAICIEYYSETKNNALIVVDETPYFALRDLLEFFGADVCWTDDEREVKTIIDVAGERLQLVQDVEKQIVKTIENEYDYKVVGGKLYLPYDFYEEILNYGIEYENDVLIVDVKCPPKGMDISQWEKNRIVNHLPEYAESKKKTEESEIVTDDKKYSFYQKGIASWYGADFEGRRTSAGERFSASAMTAAHRELPFGTMIRVTAECTGESIVVRINDRGPFHSNRILDLSQAAARAIGLESKGVGEVTIEIIEMK